MSSNPTFILRGSCTHLSDLELLTTLGVGTFGRVHLCHLRNDQSGEVFALKVMKKTVVLRLKQVEHVTNEKSILQRINSPFVPHLYASFQSTTCLYFLSEFVIGGELFKRLRSEGTFPNDVALFYTTEIVCAFAYLHSNSIAYRDLKPENVLIDIEGHLKLVDFGFAKVIVDKTYTLCGTPEYLAPESIDHQGHNHGVDWWALGIFIYEMLTGSPPFYDDNPYSLYQKILECSYEIPADMHPEAGDLIAQLLDTDRFNRLGIRVNGTQGGTEGVKAHPWFQGVDFLAVESRLIPVPWLPEVQREDDASNYDQYPDSCEPQVPVFAGADPFQGF